MSTPVSPCTVRAYSEAAIPHLAALVSKNEALMERLARQLVQDVQAGLSLLVSGSGHSAIFPMELYHRAGGASFVVPVVADYLLPTSGPSVVRALERTAGTLSVMLNRFEPRKGEMIWICSQSGVNAAVVDLAIEARKHGLKPIAFTSLVHSTAVPSRHASGKRLFEVCDEVVDLAGHVGDAAVTVSAAISAGPLSTLGAVLLGHSILVSAVSQLEALGVRSVYTSVNTPEGEARNRDLEITARKRDFLLR